MISLAGRAVWALIVIVAFSVVCFPSTIRAAEPMLAHMVYFQLHHDSPAARQQLVAACNKYLSDHEGTVYFSAGTLAEDLNREVNDRDFHVALHLVFRDKAAHDKYQTHARHLKFIEEGKDSWKKVRVFDAYIAVPSGDEAQ